MSDLDAKLARHDQTFGRLGVLVRATIGEDVPAHTSAQECSRLITAVHATGARKKRLRALRRRLSPLLILATVVALTAVAMWWRARRPEPAAGIGAPTLLSADDANATTLRFSEGSELELLPRSRAHVLDSRPEGASVRLDDGSVVCRFVERARAAWTIEAGPFRVDTGSADLEVTWDAAALVMTVRVRRGQAVVQGSQDGLPKTVSAGRTETFRALAPP
jgi:ferric-dicitrate binding protein FerR (iron transport regulator)